MLNCNFWNPIMFTKTGLLKSGSDELLVTVRLIMFYYVDSWWATYASRYQSAMLELVASWRLCDSFGAWAEVPSRVQRGERSERRWVGMRLKRMMVCSWITYLRYCRPRIATAPRKCQSIIALVATQEWHHCHTFDGDGLWRSWLAYTEMDRSRWYKHNIEISDPRKRNILVKHLWIQLQSVSSGTG